MIHRAVLDALVQVGARMGLAAREGGRTPPHQPGILSSALAGSLRRQIDAHPRYVVVPADSVAAALREARTVNGVQEKLGADLIVSIALLPSRDSLVRLVSVRDLAAPEWASHRTVSSPVAATAAASGMSELVSQVLRALEEMERASRQRPPRRSGESQPRSFTRPVPPAPLPPVVPVLLP